MCKNDNNKLRNINNSKSIEATAKSELMSVYNKNKMYRWNIIIAIESIVKVMLTNLFIVERWCGLV